MASERLILVADDEPGIREALGYALEAEGYAVRLCPDGESARQAITDACPDLAILDVVMPRLDGLSLLRQIRGRSASLPVILLTSRDEEFDRVLGLELGADDYICKPFMLRELVARVRALLRRTERQTSVLADDATQKGCLRLDADSLEAWWQGQPVRFTVTEFRILAAMASRPRVVFDREMLLKAAYPDERYVNDRATDCHIKRIRRKLSLCGAPDRLIDTVYGLGYRYQPEAADASV